MAEAPPVKKKSVKIAAAAIASDEAADPSGAVNVGGDRKAKKVIVAIDESQESIRALRYALDTVVQPGDGLVLLHSQFMPHSYVGPGGPELWVLDLLSLAPKFAPCDLRFTRISISSKTRLLHHSRLGGRHKEAPGELKQGLARQSQEDLRRCQCPPPRASDGYWRSSRQYLRRRGKDPCRLAGDGKPRSRSHQTDFSWQCERLLYSQREMPGFDRPKVSQSGWLCFSFFRVYIRYGSARSFFSLFLSAAQIGGFTFFTVTAASAA
ncbi:uncharacterized protein LOC9647702 isoform X1 [Selaginella moellendorffii]|uniref:uncharacterized protein LOC9647702 isoform X1 n=1 Tax=Selaginella moellendorffii TaxID=88036 RepID=UPI000D1CC42D|nr:uncharacterized protein LOC9647702 isoform X1 [Selaginella moellendorffii]|eukprot:XP_024541071.1 uncharacterized protein LOC9647702 isoform X1 [Selaginella moellendorffii]